MKEKADKPRSIDRDLSALAARSRLHPPSLERTIQSLSRNEERPREERFMAWNGFLKAHTRLATAAAVGLVAAALLVVPVSYDKVVGQEVALSLDGTGVNTQIVQGIATELKAALAADEVGVDATMDSGKMIYTFTAKTPEKNAGAVTETFARALTARGFLAEAASTPIKERVSGNVYAMAVNNVIAISIDGKSAQELEAEIAAQLTAAGLDADVSVTMEGDDQMQVEIRAEHMGTPGEECSEPTIVLTSEGEPLGGEMETANIKVKMCEGADGQQMVVEVSDQGQTYTATVDDPQSLSDAELAARVQDLLAAQGQDFSVSAQDGRIRLMKLGDPEGETGVREISWGKLKHKMSQEN